MAVGQGALTSTLDVGALEAVETRLEVQAVAVCQAHARTLADVLELHRVLSEAGAALSTVPQVALLLQLSEGAGSALLAEAQLLTSLPGGWEALDCGLLTVAQSAVLLRAVGGLSPVVQQAVWARLQARLLAAEGCGQVLPPARLSSLLAGWVVQADPDAAQERRRSAEDAGDVAYRRRVDGLVDLFATAIPGPVAQAVLCRIAQASRAFGSADDRTAGKRRVDALVDLLLGRQQLPVDGLEGRARRGNRCGGGSGCGCRPGAQAPCGGQLLVHVPLGAALGTTGELAELVGHGPLHPDQLASILASGPQLRAVWVGGTGCRSASATGCTSRPATIHQRCGSCC